jgi:hypothetical protein
MSLITRVRLGFEVLVLAVFVYATIETRSFPELAAQFPFAVCIAGLVMSTLAIVVDVYRIRAGKDALPAELLDAASQFAGLDREETAALLKQTLRYVLWTAGLLAGIYLLTFPGAVTVFLTAFLIREGGVKPVKAALAGIAVAGGLMVIVEVMNMAVPSSVWLHL